MLQTQRLLFKLFIYTQIFNNKLYFEQMKLNDTLLKDILQIKQLGTSELISTSEKHPHCIECKQVNKYTKGQISK